MGGGHNAGPDRSHGRLIDWRQLLVSKQARQQSLTIFEFFVSGQTSTRMRARDSR